MSTFLWQIPFCHSPHFFLDDEICRLQNPLHLQGKGIETRCGISIVSFLAFLRELGVSGGRSFASVGDPAAALTVRLAFDFQNVVSFGEPDDGSDKLAAYFFSELAPMLRLTQVRMTIIIRTYDP